MIDKMDRRKFIQMTGAGVGLGMLGTAPSIVKASAPSRKINVAVVGTNAGGRAHVRGLVNLPDAEVTDIRDIGGEAIAKGIATVKGGGESNEHRGVKEV